MDTEKLAAKRKALKYTLLTFMVLMLWCQWYCTQAVAEDGGYNPLLGSAMQIGEMMIYPPWKFIEWQMDPYISGLMPGILASYTMYQYLVVIFSIALLYYLNKNFQVDTSHGSASFATQEDIVKSDLGEYQSKNGGVFEYRKEPVKLFGYQIGHRKKKIIKNSGVVIGINPYTHKLMLHDGVEHILLMAPTRSGKGVCTIIPTGLTWKHSLFFFDPKGELWQLTSGYRKNVLKQKVLKFQPLCTDGSGARWNPLAEVNYRTAEEISDIQMISSVMVRPDGETKGDNFWPDSAQALLNGIILHLLYKHDKENRPLPCPTDIMSFLSSPGMDTDELFTAMRDYPHITPEEFLELPVIDEKTGQQLKDENGIVIRHKNPLKEIYGEYIKEFKPFNDALGDTEGKIRSVDEIRVALLHKIEQGETINWDLVDGDGMPTEEPYHMLLSHPKVAECASNMLNGAEQTRASIMQTAQTSLNIYQNPVVQKNTSVSDFTVRDLLNPQETVSLYLVMEVKDLDTVKPIARLFIQMICSKLIQDMRFETDPNKPPPKKQRLLLMLDEFPQLGNMKCIELALAICAGYGIKMLIVCQDVNQLNKAYTKDNSIGSNCHLHSYYTPNIDSGGATAEAISKSLGKKTITTESENFGKSLFGDGGSRSKQGRELMTPDEVSHMSSEKELVFVAGHKPILGDKLRYYTVPWLLKRTQIRFPAISDTVTQIRSYQELNKVHAADIKKKEEDKDAVLSAKAKQLHMSLKDYKLKLEEERKAHEEEIIRKITGQSDVTEDNGYSEAGQSSQEGGEPIADESWTADTAPLDNIESAGNAFSVLSEDERIEARRRITREHRMRIRANSQNQSKIFDQVISQLDEIGANESFKSLPDNDIEKQETIDMADSAMSGQAENISADLANDSSGTEENANTEDGYQNDVYNIVMEPGIDPDELSYEDADEEPDEPTDELPEKAAGAIKLDLIKLYNSDEDNKN